MDKRKIIIDTDPGIDDAVALAVLLFEPSLDVKLITTVSGNVSVEKTTANMLKLMALFNKNVPIAKGANRPLMKEPRDASGVHGATGMDGYEFPSMRSELLMKEHAVEAMANVLKKEKNIILVTIGPLTNIALLLRLYPEVIENIDEIIMMGGSLDRGNFGVMSEFNIGYDPESAKIVMHSGIPITMIGMNIGQKALVKEEISEKIKNMNKVGDMFYHLFKKYRGGSFKTGLKMYDASAVAYLLKPDMFEIVETYVDVETQGLCSGATLVDLRGYLKQEPNMKVALDIDSNAFVEWLVSAIEKM